MISKISNYVINNKFDKLQSVFSYIDMVEVTPEDIKNEIIKNNRSISVDVLLDERPSTDLDQKESIDNLYNTMGTISPKILSVNMSATIYKNPIDIENSTLNLLNNLTSASNTNVIAIYGELPSEIERKILFSMRVCSEKIIQESRLGRATTIILGRNIVSYLNIDEIQKRTFDPIRCDILVSDKIDPDKVIVMRVEDKLGIGLNVVDNPDKSLFYLKESNNYEKVIKWFFVK